MLTRIWSKIDGQKTKLAMLFWVVYSYVLPEFDVPSDIMRHLSVVGNLLTAVGLGHWVVKGVLGGKK